MTELEKLKEYCRDRIAKFEKAMKKSLFKGALKTRIIELENILGQIRYIELRLIE